MHTHVYALQYLLIAQIGLYHKQLTRFNKIAIQDKTPTLKVDKEAIGLLSPHIFHPCITRPSEIFVDCV